MRLPITTLLLLSLVLLSGCDQDKPHPAARTVHPNPNPQHAYQLTLTLKDAPGPFTYAKGIAQFDVVNNSTCGYTQRDTGIIERELELVPFEINKLSETEYIGIVYTDNFIDEDYYKKGICHWSLTDARMIFGRTEDIKENKFVIRIPGNIILSQGSELRYYLKDRYQYKSEYNNSDYGLSIFEYQSSENHNKLFLLSISSKEVNR